MLGSIRSQAANVRREKPTNVLFAWVSFMHNHVCPPSALSFIVCLKEVKLKESGFPRSSRILRTSVRSSRPRHGAVLVARAERAPSCGEREGGWIAATVS